jgi:hypothetical protein
VLPPLKTQAATGLSLEAFLANRKLDWIPLLNEVILRSSRDRGLYRYLTGWLKGHFITKEDLSVAVAPEMRTRRRPKKAA